MTGIILTFIQQEESFSLNLKESTPIPLQLSGSLYFGFAMLVSKVSGVFTYRITHQNSVFICKFCPASNKKKARKRIVCRLLA